MPKSRDSETSFITRNDASGKAIHYTWGFVEFKLQRDGIILRLDGKPKSVEDSYWRTNADGKLEILDADRATVTKSFIIIETPDGLFGLGAFT